MEFREAPEVKAIADELIVNYHTHLISTRIDYLFVDKAPKSKGKEVWGYALKITGLAAFLAAADLGADGERPFFVVVIAEPVWRRLNEPHRRALVDHELCHCWADDDGLYILGHDLEEFGAIVKRHGLWREDITRFLGAAGQLAMFEDVGD